MKKATTLLLNSSQTVSSTFKFYQQHFSFNISLISTFYNQLQTDYTAEYNLNAAYFKRSTSKFFIVILGSRMLHNS